MMEYLRNLKMIYALMASFGLAIMIISVTLGVTDICRILLDKFWKRFPEFKPKRKPGCWTDKGYMECGSIACMNVFCNGPEN